MLRPDDDEPTLRGLEQYRDLSRDEVVWLIDHPSESEDAPDE